MRRIIVMHARVNPRFAYAILIQKELIAPLRFPVEIRTYYVYRRLNIAYHVVNRFEQATTAKLFTIQELTALIVARELRYFDRNVELVGKRISQEIKQPV